MMTSSLTPSTRLQLVLGLLFGGMIVGSCFIGGHFSEMSQKIHAAEKMFEDNNECSC